MASVETEMADAPAGARQSLHISDVPDEVLVLIFENLRGRCISEDDFDPTIGVRDVQNLRLTCRRFCEASSHLLIHTVCVAMEPQSVSRLGLIAAHPSISKGVRRIKVLLHYYHSQLAGDFRRFFHYCKAGIETFITLVESHLTNEEPENQEVANRGKLLIDMTTSIFEALDMGLDAYEDGTLPAAEPVVLQHLGPIILALDGYQKRMAEQDILRYGGGFAESVAHAMASMPMVRALEITDCRQKALALDWPPAPIIDRGSWPEFLEPLEWWEATTYGVGSPPLDAMVNIIGSLSRPGILLTRMNMNVTLLWTGWRCPQSTMIVAG
ncbi:Uu.00g110810.m01.CDS01 [Anthostomella pinea]|uniref:Uu.00g110810.m01.CDS01 n=1 Tax=Anthostomella pinea TaxID=933095 RepID=A0AAI8YDW3_9PEZI|nr:Uu.00g110810.m01.CDS01 [Anthostomella pinea]